MRLKDNVAIITGGSRGIGFAHPASRFAVNGLVFPASDEASYSTGVVLRVDGMAKSKAVIL